MKVEWWWSDGGGPSHLLYSDTEEVGGLDTRCCCLAVLEWTGLELRAVLNLYPVGKRYRPEVGRRLGKR